MAVAMDSHHTFLIPDKTARNYRLHINAESCFIYLCFNNLGLMSVNIISHKIDFARKKCGNHNSLRTAS